METNSYCPEGHQIIFLPSSLLYHDCYYCQECNKLYQSVLEEIDSAKLPAGRFEALRQLTLISEARKKVKKDDLIKLGLLKLEKGN